jgi:hypothetical protein
MTRIACLAVAAICFSLGIFAPACDSLETVKADAKTYYCDAQPYLAAATALAPYVEQAILAATGNDVSHTIDLDKVKAALAILDDYVGGCATKLAIANLQSRPTPITFVGTGSANPNPVELTRAWTSLRVSKYHGATYVTTEAK